jgi:hypothetical protein
MHDPNQPDRSNQPDQEQRCSNSSGAAAADGAAEPKSGGGVGERKPTLLEQLVSGRFSPLANLPETLGMTLEQVADWIDDPTNRRRVMNLVMILDAQMQLVACQHRLGSVSRLADVGATAASAETVRRACADLLKVRLIDPWKQTKGEPKGPAAGSAASSATTPGGPGGAGGSSPSGDPAEKPPPHGLTRAQRQAELREAMEWFGRKSDPRLQHHDHDGHDGHDDAMDPFQDEFEHEPDPPNPPAPNTPDAANGRNAPDGASASMAGENAGRLSPQPVSIDPNAIAAARSKRQSHTAPADRRRSKSRDKPPDSSFSSDDARQCEAMMSKLSSAHPNYGNAFRFSRGGRLRASLVRDGPLKR